MIVLVSLFLLDLRFVVARAVEGMSTRELWLRPQWLWADRNLMQVGKLGNGTPIPGRKRSFPPPSEYASVEGGLVLQTAGEFQQKKLMPSTGFGSFTLLNREIVAGRMGQVRFDLLFQCAMNSQTQLSLLKSLLTLDLTAPLYNDGEPTSLMNAPSTVAGVYESESLKTCSGYRDTASRSAATEATRGSVLVAADSPNLVLIDVDAELAPSGAAALRCGQACPGDLRLGRVAVDGTDVLVWHFLPDRRAPLDLDTSVWDAAFDLCWLLGQLHELTVFKTRLDEYDRNRERVLAGLVRAAVIDRNKWFGADGAGEWDPRQVLSLAAQNLWNDEDEVRNRIADIRSFARSKNDERGVAGNFIYIANQLINEGTMSGTSQGNIISGNTGSIINLGSTLTNVSQSISALPNANQAAMDELKKLVADLQDLLQKLPAEKSGEANAVASATSDLVSKAADPKSSPGLIQWAINSAKGAAELIKDAAPVALSLVTAIGSLIARLHGIPLP